MTRSFEGITDRRLLDRLVNGQPLTHPDGQPYTAVDFFALYIEGIAVPGAQPPDAPKAPEPVLTQEMLNTWREGLRLGFRECCKALMAPPGEAWQVVSQRAVTDFDLAPEDLVWTQEVIAGIIEPTVEQAINMRRKYGSRTPLIKAMLVVVKEAGGNVKHAEELMIYMDSNVPIPKELTIKDFPLLLG